MPSTDVSMALLFKALALDSKILSSWHWRPQMLTSHCPSKWAPSQVQMKRMKAMSKKIIVIQTT
jgi:hypothetical protein